jgi:single-stranded-DNA-specific exonuclease
LITVDCGISAVAEIAHAKELGMDVILTDHHEPPCDGIPNAYAIINPKVYGSSYPFKNVAGCVVSLKTMQALMLTYRKEYDKEIMVCFAVKNNNDFSGTYICLKNDLKIEKADFESVWGIKQIVNRAFRIYTNNVDVKNLLVQNNVLLKDKIIVVEDIANNLEDVVKAYNIKKLEEDSGIKDFFEENLDLCALGTITDSMPLIDENRIIVKEGLKIIETHHYAKPGLGLLLDDVLFSKGLHNVTAKMISWNVSPVLNSAGRMAKGVLAAELLMTKDAFKARTLYSYITKLNADRRCLQSVNVEEFKHLLKEQCDVENDKVLIVKALNLHHGVTGIIASQMVKTYSKPVFLFITDGKEAMGTARSMEDFDVVAALESVKDILIKYGGHSQAAGFTLEDSKIDEFIERLSVYADKNLKGINSVNTIVVESELKISDINMDFYKQVKMLEPFGIGNLRPVFCIKGVTPTEVSVFGNKGEHLKFKISQKGSKNVQAVFWNKSKLMEIVGSESSLDIAFHINVTGKNENKIAQLHVIDIKPVY